MKRPLPLFLLLLLFGCAQPSWVKNGYVVRFEKSPETLSPENVDFKSTVRVQWLGVSGFVVSLDQHALLFAPFFSKQPIGKIGFQKVKVNTELIDRKMPPAKNIEAILVPHAHYDHILDVPYIMKKHATNATTYGSRTAVNILAGWGISEERRIEIPQEKWIYTKSRRIRFISFEGDHAPHLAGVIRIWDGTIEEPLSEPPSYAREYQKGKNLNYLVEFLDEEEKPVYTLFYQDGVVSGELGLPTVEHRPIDLLLLTVPGWTQVEDYPKPSLERFRPKEIILSHWDEFLQEPEEGLQILRNCNLDGFLVRTQEILEENSIPATIIIPTIGARMNFPLEHP